MVRPKAFCSARSESPAATADRRSTSAASSRSTARGSAPRASLGGADQVRVVTKDAQVDHALSLTGTPTRDRFRSSRPGRMVDMPVVMSRPEFEDLVAEALDLIPAEFTRAMDNVVILVEDRHPTQNLYGLYHGVALTSRTSQLLRAPAGHHHHLPAADPGPRAATRGRPASRSPPP